MHSVDCLAALRLLFGCAASTVSRICVHCSRARPTGPPYGLSDYSVRSVFLEYIYSLYYMASLLTFINPLLLNGDSLGTSVIFGTHLNRIADSNINLS